MTVMAQDPVDRLPLDTSIGPITEKEFALFQTLIQEEAGIRLSEAKKALLVGRLSRRLRELGLSSFSAYYRRVVKEGDEEERVRMLDCICTNETHFFREPQHFAFLEQEVFPEWISRGESGSRARRVRVWSAGCSTGEEPYSLAMILWEHFPPSAGWDVEILATDLSTRVLEKAKEAIWRMNKSEEIPSPYLKKFMLRGIRSQEGKMKAGSEIRSLVRFQRLNLNDGVYSFTGSFDLIFCRNVLIYFAAESKARVVQRLLDRMEPNGYLFLGHAEGLTLMAGRAKSVIPTVYTPVKIQNCERKTR
jgi:chemotaxis protein methyltransferase CheR